MTKKKNSKPKPQTLDEWLRSLPTSTAQRARQHRTRLKRLFRNPSRDDVTWWYRVGECLVGLSDASEGNYGVGLIELMADEIEPGRDPAKKSIITELYLYRDLARHLSSAEVGELAKKIEEGVIFARHVAILAGLDDKVQRDNLLEKCVQNRLSANELRRQVQNLRGPAGFGGRRPKPRTKSNRELAARDIVVQARRWEACFKPYFKAYRAPLASLPRVVDRDLLRELEAALDAVQQVSRLASEAERLLLPVVKKARAKVVC